MNTENTDAPLKADCPSATCSASFPLCPRCKKSSKMEMNPAELRYSCAACKTTWSRNYLKGWNDGFAPMAKYGQTEKREPYPPIPEDMESSVDKLREALYDNPCCLGDDDGSVHFLSDAELYYAIKAVIPFLPNVQGMLSKQG